MSVSIYTSPQFVNGSAEKQNLLQLHCQNYEDGHLLFESSSLKNNETLSVIAGDTGVVTQTGPPLAVGR